MILVIINLCLFIIILLLFIGIIFVDDELFV